MKSLLVSSIVLLSLIFGNYIGGVEVNDISPDYIESIESAYINSTENLTFDFTLTFTGDVLIASQKNQTISGSFNEYANNNPPTYFLEKVKPIFEKDDYTIVNLENVCFYRVGHIATWVVVVK